MENYRTEFTLTDEIVAKADAYLKANYEEPRKCYENVRFSVSCDARWSVGGSLSPAQMQRLRAAVATKPETFSQALIRIIREKGMTNPECYQKALVSKQHFSKIQSDADYRPTRETVFAFAIALSLPLDQCEALLKTAGFAFSNSRKTDVIVKFAIVNGIHNVMLVNELLDCHHERAIP